METSFGICPIWKTPAIELCRHGEGEREFDSPRAGGRYLVTENAEEALKKLDASVKARLTTWLIDQRHFGTDCPIVDLSAIENSKSRRPLPVHERADRLLSFFADRGPCPGNSVSIPKFRGDRNDLYRGIACLESSIYFSPDDFGDYDQYDHEVTFFLKYLEKKGWLDLLDSQAPDDARKCRLTVDGYARLAELEETHVPSSRVFVAMWFDESMNSAFKDGIALGIRDAGYDPVRIDRKEHINKVDDEIIAEIRRSRFVVADFTHGNDGARGGVYFEAGFALGIGIPVIFSCQKDKFEEVHFDTRQYNHIVWETPDELRDKLGKRIAAILGDGPVKPPDSIAG